MTNIIADAVLDGGLNVIHEAASTIVLCSTDPTTYTEAVSTFAIGSKSFAPGGAFGAPSPAIGGGRAVSSTAITDGAAIATGFPSGWAAVDDAARRLLANGRVPPGDRLDAAAVFTLPAFVVGLRNT
jgi:hypothetical protein